MRSIAAPALLATLALVAGAVAGVVGCDRQADRAADPGVASAPATTASPEPDGPTFTPATGSADGGPGSGNGLGLTGVRTAHHPGYDRVVFELGGSGTLGWHVEYTADPVYDGSGEPVDVAGTAYLSVVLRGLGLPFDTGVAPYGDDATRVPGAGTEGVAEIAPGGVFEGDQQAYIGLRGAERAFRVVALTHPTRLVVDVRLPA